MSNTWAEEYADYLLARGIEIKAFAEMRVHAPQSFWVKLALSGVTTLQLGVEAISELLLNNMRKRTTVAQNLAATKYMAEMGTNNASNLIINHPKSTVGDVEETKRIMQLLEHFPIFSLSNFVVSYASPIYNELSQIQKAQLRRGFDWLSPEFEKYSWPRHLSYTWPRDWFDRDTMVAWLEFQLWYSDHVRKLVSRPDRPRFTVRRQNDRLVLTDTRFNQKRHYSLSGDAMKVFSACHTPSTVGRVKKITGLNAMVAMDQLSALEAAKAVIRIGDCYLSVALRSRDELIDELLNEPDRRAIVGLGSPAAQVYGVG